MPAASDPYRILFVCTGNICRSPTAEAVLRAKAIARGLAERIEIDSAGIQNEHSGQTPDPRSCEVASGSGYTLESLRARQVGPEDFERFDLILALDEGHQKELLSRARDHHAKVALFLPYAGVDSPKSVADPFYSDKKAFRDTLGVIEQGCDGLLDRLERDALSEPA